MWEDLRQADNFQQLLNFFSQYSEYSNSQFVKVSKSLWQRHLSGVQYSALCRVEADCYIQKIS